MKLYEFTTQFPDEESCRTKYREYRQNIGVVCPKCGCTAHYWVGGKTQMFKCKNCSHMQSLKSHTVLHKSKLSFKTWFIALYYLTSTKSTISAAELQRQLGLKYYKPVWCMLQKIRNAMEHNENEYKLSGEVELDECFFQIDSELNKSKAYSRDHLVNVLIMAESEPVTYKTKKKYQLKYKLGNIKMRVIPNISKVTIRETALGFVSKDATLRTDGAKATVSLKETFRDSYAEVLKDTSDVMRVLPYVHLNIGWCKDRFKYVYHGIEREYFQLYLSEFCWKQNHRGSKDIFGDLLKVIVDNPNDWFPTVKRKGKIVIPEVLHGIKLF